jgi:hypothetical protein
MIKDVSNSRFIALLILNGFIISCSTHQPQIKSIYVYNYTIDYSTDNRYLSAFEIPYFSDDELPNKNKYYNKHISYSNTGEVLNYGMNYYSTLAESNFSFDFYYRFYPEDSLIDIGVTHYVHDTINKIKTHLYFAYHKDSSLYEDSEMSVLQYGDDFEYVQLFSTAQYCPALMRYYIDSLVNRKDTSNTLYAPPLPKISLCSSKIASSYEKRWVNPENKSHHTIVNIDSSFTNDTLAVAHQTYEYDYYYYKKGKRGMDTHVYVTPYTYDVQRSKKGEQPIYYLRVRLDSVTRDTLWRSEQIFTRNKIGWHATYDYFSRPVNWSALDTDELYIYRMITRIQQDKEHKILTYDEIGYSNKGHILEYSFYHKNGKRIVTKNNRILPDLEGKPNSEIGYSSPYDARNFYRTYKNTTSKKHKPIPQSYNFSNYYGETILIEKNKKLKYEKRMALDSLTVFEIYYK